MHRCGVGYPVIGAAIPQGHQVGVELSEIARLLAALVGLGLQPGRELGGEVVQLAGAVPVRFFGSTTSCFRYFRIVFRDSPVRLAISGMAIPSRRRQRLITFNNTTSITPSFPCSSPSRSVSYVGQNSMQIPTAGGLLLSANQQSPDFPCRRRKTIRAWNEPVGCVRRS